MSVSFELKYEDDYYVGERKGQEKKPKKEIQRRRKTDAPIRKTNRKWTELETSMFYRALQMYGTNMDLILQKMGNGFSRDDISSKFKYENRINANLIAVAMNKCTNVQLKGVMTFGKNPLLQSGTKLIPKCTNSQISNTSDSDSLSSSSLND